MFDVYKCKADPSLRIATEKGVGLPSHVVTTQWEITGEPPQIDSDYLKEDIQERGLCLYKLVGVKPGRSK